MRVSTGVFVAALSLLALGAAEPENGPPVDFKVIRGAEASAPVIATSWDGDLRRLPVVPEWKPGDPIIEIPRRVRTSVGRRRETVEDYSAVPQIEPPPYVRGAGPQVFTTPILNFNGNGYTGASPPDPVGDVSPTHYVQSVNGASGAVFNVYDKNGVKLSGPTAMETLGTGSCASGAGDPIVLYDPLADRWLLSEFSATGNHFCIYISKTNNPIIGGWWAYNFTLSQFPDYPKYAVWPDAYYVTSNESSPAAYALDRANMLNGLPATMQRFTAPDLPAFPFQALTPSDVDGATPPPAGTPNHMMRHRDDEANNPGANDPVHDFLEMFDFHVDFANPGNSTFTGPITVTTSEFDSDVCGFSTFSCFRQPTGSARLDPVREVLMWRLQYRNFGAHETMVGSFTVDSTGADVGALRWFELRRSGAGPWTVFQEETYSPDTTNRWMGSAAMDGSGDIAAGYNVVSLSVFPGIRYAGRLPTDPLGTLPQGETTLVAGTASSSTNRYGDYSAMTVDPADDCTFWYTAEYNTSGNWSTRIGSFKFDSCGAAEFCGDTICGANETQCSCPEDCGPPPATEVVGATCNDTIDNDCDGPIDCADSDCATDPSCTSCLPRGASCTSNDECCSNRCKQRNGRCR